MAKNKNRDRAKQARTSAEQGKASPAESRAEQMPSQPDSSAMARKGRQKRFGHN
ncbi:hypothetical protein [Streptomyces palmae]|uniref:hypothetical protein n=1 Tax=Streptomyces palmae TaxID=1701085 RepID=UPI001432BAD0|nr:hypothetical protein [Streptomyces palmae]